MSGLQRLFSRWRRRDAMRLVAAVVGLSIVALVLSTSCPLPTPFWSWEDPSRQQMIHLAVVVCGERAEEALTMLKSAVILTTHPFHAHVFADDNAMSQLNSTLREWTVSVNWTSFSFSIYKIQFPEGTDTSWRSLFKPCACQRLFIPDLLTEIEALIYVDTDVIFLSPPESLWQHFSAFNKSHIAALAPETEDAQSNWYVRFARHPFYRPLGVNSGVMLMNLTRMRHFQWGSFLWPLYQKYRYNITWGDQDIINIIFSMNPNRLYVYGCEWNFRPDHCMYTSTCKAAESGGAKVLHGSRGYFHKKDKQPAFLTTYQTLRSFPLSSTSVCLNFLPRLDRELKVLPPTSNCARVHEIFLHSLRRYCER